MAKMDVQKIIAPMMKFVNMRGIIALKDGMLAILPLTVVGSLFLIMGQLPFEGLNKSIASVFGANWTEPFMQVYSGTFAIMGLISCFSIAYSYAKNSGVEALPAGVLSVSAFFKVQDRLACQNERYKHNWIHDNRKSKYNWLIYVKYCWKSCYFP